MGSVPDVHVHVTGPVTVVLNEDVSQRLDAILAILTVTTERVSAMAIDLTAVQASVEENTSVDQSAIVLIEALAQQVRDLADQVAQEPAVQAALNDLAAQLSGSSGQLGAAVTANTGASG